MKKVPDPELRARGRMRVIDRQTVVLSNARPLDDSPCSRQTVVDTVAIPSITCGLPVAGSKMKQMTA